MWKIIRSTKKCKYENLLFRLEACCYSDSIFIDNCLKLKHAQTIFYGYHIISSLIMYPFLSLKSTVLFFHFFHQNYVNSYVRFNKSAFDGIVLWPFTVYNINNKHRRVTTFSKHTFVISPRRFNFYFIFATAILHSSLLVCLQAKNNKKNDALLISVSLLLFQIVHVEII